MKKRSKRYRAEEEKIDRSRKYTIEEAIGKVKELSSTKFDQTVEIALKLNIDPRKSDQMVRGALSLPRGVGKTKKVIVFADGEEAKAAEEAGAVAVGMADLAEKIEGGWMEFDVAIAVRRAMRVVGKLGKILGPQGKMPSPKSGTVTDDVKAAVEEFKAGKMEIRNDKEGNLHAAVGKVSFPPEHLKENVDAFLGHIRGMRPQTVKGNYITRAAMSASMSPSIPLVV